MMKNKILFLAICISMFCLSSVRADGLNPLLEASMKYENIRVAHVRAVDRLLLENGEKIALIGIKGPRPPHMKDVRRDEHGFILPEDDPKVPFEEEAIRFTRDLCEGRFVRIEFDSQRRDDEGFILAYVILPDGKLLNAELVRAGYAALKLTPPNMKYAEKIRAAYQEARHAMRGLQGEW